MRFQKFEDIIAWQKGQDLAIFIYKLFSNNRDFSFKDQICRASVSISNNIAEGFDRSSIKEFQRFLYISRASSSEVKSMLYLAKRLEYINEIDFKIGLNLSSELGRIINGLINSLDKSPD